MDAHEEAQHVESQEKEERHVVLEVGLQAEIAQRGQVDVVEGAADGRVSGNHAPRVFVHLRQEVELVAAQKVEDDREGQDEDDEDHHEGGDVVEDHEDDVDVGRDLVNQLHEVERLHQE